MQVAARHLIRSNPTLYWVWLKVKYGYPHKLPCHDADLHIDGFQRSGNTFSTTLLRTLFPTKKIVSHFHAVASLKLAMRYDIPTLIVVRHPEEAIASSIVKRVLGRGQRRKRSIAFDLEGYSNYYEFVLAHLDRFSVVFFDEFINKPEVVVSTASSIMDVECPDRESINRAADKVVAFLKSDDRVAALHSLGSPEKTALKKTVLREISEAPQMARAIGIYNMVCRKFR